ncbi:ABC transporter substrate-binding protein [Photobacterium jeanii]|uniref:ABC transporter substrate-binding protein n=1 Tax=Photobacterium jeanii TaxID=858640 RepID=A0A178K9J7_9GAMM|nr:ABC transporter substrate-binding protein [Photobacterium jeanii]PST89406.1 ABC transporter substrate-binding protein [Photobacterium jeanii]
MSSSKKLAVTAAALSLSVVSSFAHAEDILTATPVTYMLASELTKGTELDVSYLPPKRYGVTRMPNWFNGQGSEVVTKAAKEAKVAVTIGAVWPSEPLYVHARQGNIGIIEVDATQSISPRATGVAALRLDDGSISPFAWLNPANLTRMAAIVSTDLQKVWPEQADKIEKNQQSLMIAVRQLINKQQQQLMDAEVDSVILLSSELEDFASGNQLFVVERLTKPELEWTEEDKANLKSMLTEDDSVWVLTSRKMSANLKALVPNPEKVLVIDSVDRWGRAGIDQAQPLKRWQLAL